MSDKTKRAIVFVLAQAGCLAVGLWMQDQFTVRSGINSASDYSHRVLEDRLNTLINEFTAHRSANPSAAALSSVVCHKVLDSLSPHDPMLIVDKNWRIRHAGPAVIAKAGPTLAGTEVIWTPSRRSPQNQQNLERGKFDLLGASQLAVAARVEPLDGFVILYRSEREVLTLAQATVEATPAISLLTFIWTSAILGICAYMILARFHEESEGERTRSLADALRQRQELVRTRDAVVFGLAKLADSRDPETGDHLERISVYSTLLASVLRRHPRYGNEVTPAFVRLIGISSALHDIGKVGVEDQILRKAGPLTPDERTRMQSHTVVGNNCLRQIEQRLGSSNFLQMAREIALCHHERWDGGGYPQGLRGDQIPLSARIVAIADVYDALSSKRVYKNAQTHEECVAIIRAAAGTHFDPDLVEAWLAIEPKFAEVADRYAGQPSGSVEQPTEPALSTGSPKKRRETDGPLVEYDHEALLAAVRGDV